PTYTETLKCIGYDITLYFTTQGSITEPVTKSQNARYAHSSFRLPLFLNPSGMSVTLRPHMMLNRVSQL
ncbi:hypothetical protein L9F63_003632, partial [Diploptera punctata]